MNRIPKYRGQGITLIEILLYLGLLGILASFASVSASNATVRADMRAASENLQYSIRIARDTARITESVVSMNLLQEPGEGIQRVTFSAARLAETSLSFAGIQDYQFNEKIKLVSDFPSYEFSSRGVVKNPGQITLVYRADETVTTQIMVE